jgi:predicted metalloprotease
LGCSFEPLLQAEHDEAERTLLQRLKDWPLDRLEKDGYMLEGLGARVEPKLKSNEGTVVTFNKTGKDGKKPLTPHHKFE